jgi:hypothetical protein
VRRALVALALVLGTSSLAAPARAWEGASAPTNPWEFTSIRAYYGYSMGLRAGTRALDGALVGVPYSEQAGWLEFELERYDGRRPGAQDFPDFLGVALGLRIVARAGLLGAFDYPEPEGIETSDRPVGWLGPVRASFGGGTLAQLVRTEDFVLAAHFSTDVILGRATWITDPTLAFYPGLRLVWQPDPVRLQLAYDFLPFWLGDDRIEHRASSAIAFHAGPVGIGLRFQFSIGQERRAEGGYDDMLFAGALELVL